MKAKIVGNADGRGRLVLEPETAEERACLQDAVAMTAMVRERQLNDDYTSGDLLSVSFRVEREDE